MSTKKAKKLVNFRIDTDVYDKIRELTQKDPLVYQSQAKIVDAALHYFLNLQKSEHKEIIKKYLTKDL